MAQRNILSLQYNPYTGVAQSNMLRWTIRDLHPSLARHTSTFNEFFFCGTLIFYYDATTVVLIGLRLLTKATQEFAASSVAKVLLTL